MPIELTLDESAFVRRVEGYCREGLAQPEMAKREDLSLTGFRDKLRNCGLAIEARTERFVVHFRTGAPLASLVERGEIVCTDDREAVPA